MHSIHTRFVAFPNMASRRVLTSSQSLSMSIYLLVRAAIDKSRFCGEARSSMIPPHPGWWSLRSAGGVERTRVSLLESTKLFSGTQRGLRPWQRNWAMESGRPFRTLASLWRSNLQWSLWQTRYSRWSFEFLRRRWYHPL